MVDSSVSISPSRNRFRDREIKASMVAHTLLAKQFSETYGVKAKVRILSEVGLVVEFEVQGVWFRVKYFNRKRRLELGHIPRAFWKLDGYNWIVSASPLTKGAHDEVKRHWVGLRPAGAEHHNR